MNGKFMKNVAFQALVIAPAILVAVTDFAGMALYAERLLSFFGVLLLVCGLIAAGTAASTAKKDGSEDRYQRSKAHLAFSTTVVVIEVCIFAALGWYWVAAGFMVSAISSAIIRAEIAKLEDE